jgi:Fe-S-cluster-containing hydrogenase component 2
VTRLIREGLRFGHFLVATSCRSCMDPHCLVGCPVDSIHRRPPTDQRNGLEIVIEDWCIGCGLCASNCPYGNISMHETSIAPVPGRKAVVRKAVTCDLCRSIVDNEDEEVSCVYACPHDAAHRMSGPTLFELVKLATTLPGAPTPA